MIAVIGATGQTGSVVVNELLRTGRAVRAVVRDPKKAEAWKAKGADVAVADAGDVAALAKAFAGCASAYLMNPPAYLEADPFARGHQVHAAMIEAGNRAGLKRVVALSSIGAQHAAGTGNILATHDLEQQLNQFKGSATIVRAAYFMENFAWVLHPVLENGVLPSMVHPVGRKIPMQSVVDIGETAARLLADATGGRAIVELQGPAEYSPADAAAIFAKLLKKPINVVAVPEDQWGGVYASLGFPPKTVAAFCEMMRGINSGHVSFEGTHTTLRGHVTLDQALARLVKP